MISRKKTASPANASGSASSAAAATQSNGTAAGSVHRPAPAATLPPIHHTSQPQNWTFLSNHAHVLICLAIDPGQRLRDVADRVGITERAVQKIVADLEEAGVVDRQREGRRNRYQIHPDVPLRHPVEAHQTVRSLLAIVLSPADMKKMDWLIK